MSNSRIIQNARWIIGCKLLQSLLQMLIGMVSARYLGPGNYGLLSYAASLVAFAMPVMKLGLDAILVRELVAEPDREGEILGTALGCCLISGLGGMAGVNLFALAANPGDSGTVLVCLLSSFSLLCAAVAMVQYWYQARLLAKYPSVGMLLCYGAVSGYKLFLLATRKGVSWFALAHALEYGLVGLSLLVLYRTLGGGKLGFSPARARVLLSRSKFYLLAALMTVVIQNADRIMLTNLLGSRETGLYSAAMTAVSVFQFVFTAITDSFRPQILAQRETAREGYFASLRRLSGTVFYLALAQGAGFFLLARWVIGLLYGPEYLGAAAILRLLGVYFLFSALGLVRNVWVLAEGKQRYLWVINGSGAVVNVALNRWLIPLWGAWGAALAALITQVFANFLLGFWIPALRPWNKLLLSALNPRNWADAL